MIHVSGKNIAYYAGLNTGNHGGDKGQTTRIPYFMSMSAHPRIVGGGGMLRFLTLFRYHSLFGTLKRLGRSFIVISRSLSFLLLLNSVSLPTSARV